MILAWHVKHVETLGIQGTTALRPMRMWTFVNNNNYFRPQQNQGWNYQQRLNYHGNYQGNNFNNFNQPLLRELIASQSRLMEGLSKKVATNNKILENISNRMDSFASAIKNQHSFNKRGSCVLAPTLMCNYDFALVFLTLWFCPSLRASQCDFAPSQRSKQEQIHKNQWQNRIDLLVVKGKITKLEIREQNHNCTSK